MRWEIWGLKWWEVPPFSLFWYFLIPQISHWGTPAIWTWLFYLTFILLLSLYWYLSYAPISFSINLHKSYFPLCEFSVSRSYFEMVIQAYGFSQITIIHILNGCSYIQHMWPFKVNWYSYWFLSFCLTFSQSRISQKKSLWGRTFEWLIAPYFEGCPILVLWDSMNVKPRVIAIIIS